MKISLTILTILLINDCTTLEIQKALENVKRPESLFLNLESTSSDQIELVAMALNNSKITHLNLRGKLKTDESAVAIGEILANTVITNLDIGGNSYGWNGYLAIFTVLKKSRITSLTLSNNVEKIKDQEIEILARVLKETVVNRLNLYGNEIGERGARTLAEHLQLTEIGYLNLGKNPIGIEGALAIIDSLNRTRIKSLNLECTGARGVASALGRTPLIHLNLNGNGIEAKEALAIINRAGIKSLELGSNDLEIGRILNAVKNTDIVHLNLDGSKDVGEIESALTNTKLLSLGLGRNNFGNNRIKEIARALNKTGIRNLGFAGNRIGYRGTLAIASILNFTGIRSLDLSGNGFGNMAARALAEGLKYSTVNRLNIGANSIGDDGMIAIAEILKHSRINVLDLAWNRNTLRGAMAVVKALPGSDVTDFTMFGVDDADNLTTYDVLDALIDALPMTLITRLKIGEYLERGDCYHLGIIVALNRNQLKVDTMYREFKELVGGGVWLEFKDGIEPWRCRNFAAGVKGNEGGYVWHFTWYEDGGWSEDQIFEFLDNIERKVHRCSAYYYVPVGEFAYTVG